MCGLWYFRFSLLCEMLCRLSVTLLSLSSLSTLVLEEVGFFKCLLSKLQGHLNDLADNARGIESLNGLKDSFR